MTSNARINSKGQIIEELDVDLEKETKDPVSASLQKFIYKHDTNKIDEMEILAWCEIYLAAKKKGTSLFYSSGK
jgi:hypothetical protein